jgi:calcineurin-like phosphoesterase family protein
VMVLGNHDVDKISDLREYAQKNPKRFLLVEGLNGVSEVNNSWFSAFTQDINGQKVLFSHYPVLSSDPYFTGQITETVGLLKQCFINEGCNLNVHGHLHSKDSRSNPNEINVSLERIGFKPVKIMEVILKTKSYMASS